MASILGKFFGASESADSNDQGTERSEEEFLGEEECLEEEQYKNLEPIFPKLHKKGDPTPRPTIRRCDWKKSQLPKYGEVNAYAAVIDGAFTLKECDELLRIAEASSEGGWPIAKVNVGVNREILDTSYRKGDRIIYDDQALADKMLARIYPLIEKDMYYMDPNNTGTGKGPLGYKGTAAKRRGDKFRLTRLNERLRFLKYHPSDFFRMHCDGAYTTPDRKQSSLFTFHLYLNDKTGDVPLKGGSTRFWEFNTPWRPDLTKAQLKKRGMSEPLFHDVNPVPGRVLVFQHAFLLHSGEPIVEGIKLTIRTDFMYERIPQEEELDEYIAHLRRNGLHADQNPGGRPEEEDEEMGDVR